MSRLECRRQAQGLCPWMMRAHQARKFANSPRGTAEGGSAWTELI